MAEKGSSERESNRLAIAIFIVATTLTVMATRFSIPSSLLFPVGVLLLGLAVTAILALLFILAKGYELRYGKKKDNLIDRSNHILYNSAMTAYVIVTTIVLLSFIYKSLNDASKAGNVWATAGVVTLFIGTIWVINWRDIRELWRATRNAWHKRFSGRR